VPTSRYSYSGMGFGGTSYTCTLLRYGRGCLPLQIRESRYCPISGAGRPPQLLLCTILTQLKHPFSASDVVRVGVSDSSPAVSGGAFSSHLRKSRRNFSRKINFVVPATHFYINSGQDGRRRQIKTRSATGRDSAQNGEKSPKKNFSQDGFNRRSTHVRSSSIRSEMEQKP